MPKLKSSSLAINVIAILAGFMLAGNVKAAACPLPTWLACESWIGDIVDYVPAGVQWTAQDFQAGSGIITEVDFTIKDDWPNHFIYTFNLLDISKNTIIASSSGDFDSGSIKSTLSITLHPPVVIASGSYAIMLNNIGSHYGEVYGANGSDPSKAVAGCLRRYNSLTKTLSACITGTYGTEDVAYAVVGEATGSGWQGSMPSSASYNFTNRDFGLLGNMFRDIIVWLFIPDPTIFNQFGGLWDSVKAKPPVGYFTQVQTAFGSFAVASGSYYLAMQDMGLITNPLRSALIWVLWLMFGFWIFQRIRKLEI